jgi:hypothetical protein
MIRQEMGEKEDNRERGVVAGGGKESCNLAGC